MSQKTNHCTIRGLVTTYEATLPLVLLILFVRMGHTLLHGEQGIVATITINSILYYYLVYTAYMYVNHT